MEKFKLFTLLTAIGVIASILSSCETNNYKKRKSVQEEVLNKFPKSQGAEVEELAFNLDDSFQSKLRSGDVGEYHYPSYYGGHYINEDKKLVVIIVSDEKQAKKELSNRAQSNNYIIQKGKFSYTSLVDISERFADFLDANTNNPIIEKHFGGAYIDIENNCYVIELNDINNNEAKDFFKKALGNSPELVFKPTSRSGIEPTSGPNLGSIINNES